ncbi:hypothetical protein AGMMS49960_03640 [Betaproteobacteria bacterium]|nr:hypothetical protein AGMMS49543_02440 [Betaproteobacteria bacterium]GHT99132.1 hypothetical protein AGMMS49960_03640 [Betaproteobacteria bacterium]GHU25151.1 hypothetical protein AGMMS50243_28920 [Betaproteobacteria bacterium]
MINSGWILDPPECFAPIPRWQSWLEKLRSMPQDDPGVAGCIVDAEKTLAWRAEVDPVIAAAAAERKAKTA